MLRLACLVVFALTSAPALAGCGGDVGPAKAAVNEVKRSLGRISEESLCLFYGDYTGDGHADALMILYYSVPDGGNSFAIHVKSFG